ncbi:MAG: phosphomannomutase/phosphoglucomutase, partial [Armatimonadetes bacterium]|nr:phosphomannomutase/phosphoglucomutase [Armatimonadota bacterium]
MAASGWAAAFKECDIRGPYPDQVDEELAYRLGLAVAAKAPGQRVVVAGDVRLSTPPLKTRLLEGLRDGGAVALDCGSLPTPGYYFARRLLGVQAGVMVTASHSPPDHNGFKPILGPLPITPEELRSLWELVTSPPPARPGGSTEDLHQSASSAYREWLLARGEEMLGADAQKLKVVVDCGNGSFSGLACEVLAELGLRVMPLFCEPDGRFPNRSPDVSRPEALQALGQAVRETGANLGVAFDGDGDRVAFTDETGTVVGPDVFVPLLAADALRRSGPGPVVLDIKLSRAADEVVQQAGGVPLRERSGHTFMKTRVIREKAVLGGEGSGHVFFRELDGGDDALYAAMVMMRLLA